MSGIFMLLIAFLVLLLAIAMKVVAKVSDSRPVFMLAVLGFVAIYILAAIAITWLNPGLPGANVRSFSDLVQPAVKSDALPAAPAQDTIIRQ